MPYCLACGTKADFEATDCPSCGQAIGRRIEPPGDAIDAGSSALWAEGDADDADDAADEDGPETTSRDTDETGSTTVDGDPAPDTTARPTTDPAGPSPFADRWSFSVAARYPVQGGYRPVVVGSIIEFFATVLPFFSLLTAGYGFRLLRAVARGQQERPAFEEYGQLLIEGLKIALVLAIYGGVLFVGAIGAVVAQAIDEPFGIALWVAVGLVTVYPLPASLTVYGATDDLRTAFSRSHTGRLVTSGTYLSAWLAWLAGAIAVAVLGLLSLVTLVGPVVVRAWGLYSLATLWGYYYRAAAARDIVPPAPDEPVR